MSLQAPCHGHEQFVAHVVAVLVVHGLEPVEVHHVHSQHFFRTATRKRGRERDVEPAAVGQAGERIGVGQRAHHVALAVCVQRLQAKGSGAQAQHTHEQQHVQRGAKLEGVQGPEVHRHPAPDHADDCGRRYKVHQPGEQQGGSDRVPQPCAAHRPRNAHERRHQPQDADDASHGAGAEQVQRIQGSQHHAQHCAPAHAA